MRYPHIVIAALSCACLAVSYTDTLNAQAGTATVALSETDRGIGTGVAAPARRERPRVFVQAFEFNATLAKAEQDELNSLAGAIAVMRGQDPNAAMQQTMANLGRAVADLLVEQLLDGGEVRVVERRALEDIIKEQDLVGGDRAQSGQDVASKAKIAGARYMVTGSITTFGQSKQQSRLGAVLGGVIRNKTGGLVGGVSSGKTLYTIGLTARIVDTETGDIVASVKTDGTVEGNKHRSVVGAGVLGAVIGGGLSTASSDERELRIAEALAMSTSALADQLVEKLQREIAQNNN